MIDHKKIEITDITQLIKTLFSYDRGWMFRGHSKESWRLHSTLERLLLCVGNDPDLMRRCETYSLQWFRSIAHNYMSHDLLPKTKLGWLALMQHHGVPTRLLDFTLSPFNALFFAFAGVPPNQKESCSMWCINYRNVNENSRIILENKYPIMKDNPDDISLEPDKVFEEYIDPQNIEMLWVTEPIISNIRLERQKGTFLLSCNINTTIETIISIMLTNDDIHEIIIPAKLSRKVFKILDKMGIDNRRIFGDLSGLASDIKHELYYQISHRVD